ncbi:MAG: hypothetical protein HOP22_01810 [Nitrospiraceae bacterium]|nr:hypothetical protein [Nitrospiraceae bacterium]
MQRFRASFLTLAITVSLLLWASIATTPAMAANVQFDFTGIVTSVTGDSVGIQSQYGIQMGSVLTNGLFRLDHGSATRLDALNFPGTYSIPVDKLSLTLGNLIVDNLGQNIPSSAGSLAVSHSSSNDSYLIITAFNNNANVLLGALAIELSDGDGTYLTNLPQLPTGPPALGSFTSRTFRLDLFTNGNTVPQGTVTGIIAPVPLPPAVILFGAGLVGLAGLGARNWRQRTAQPSLPEA